MPNLKLLFCTLSLTIFTTLPLAVTAEDINPETVKRCVSLMQIRNIEILDDQNILFHMTGKKHYLNSLPYNCSGLYRDKTIMYRTSLNQLCDLDIITVLDTVGGGFQPRASCGLGVFKPITEEDAKMLKTADREE